MKYRKLMIAMAVALVAMLSGSCFEETVGPEANGSAALKIWLNMTGDRPDPDGCAVSVDGGPAEPIPAGETLTLTDLTQGSHVVSLASVESYCTLSGANPRTVTLAAGQTAETRFDVLCGSAVPEFGLPGMDVLGSGYDVFGNYADVAYVMAHVLDLGALDKAGLLEQVQYERATFSIISGESTQEYAENLGLSVNVAGGFGGFHGAAGVNFSSSRRSQSEYSYATIQSNIKKHGVRVALHITAEELRAYLTESARAAINGATTEPEVDQLFDTYGTYVMRGLIVGGRLDFSTSANMSFDSDSIGIAAYAQASYSNAFGASFSMDVEAEYDMSMEEYSASEEKHLEVYGGQSEYGQNIINENDYRSWIESVEGRPVFMDWERGGMIGIWELADDQNQRDFLHARFAAKAATMPEIWFTETQTEYIVSNFEEGDEGWTVRGSGLPGYEQPDHRIQEGFFGGYIMYPNDPGYGLLYFFAPVDYQGPKDQFYGGALSYYIWERGVDKDCADDWSPVLRPRDVELLSPNGNLYYQFGARSLHSIVRRAKADQCGSDIDLDYQLRPLRIEIPLKPGEQTHGRWRKYDGSPAEASDIENALAYVRGLQIRGEYIGGNENFNLDKVELLSVDMLPDKPDDYRYISFDEGSSTIEGWSSTHNGGVGPEWADEGECGGGTGGCISLTDAAYGGTYMYFQLPVDPGCVEEDPYCLPNDLSKYYGARLSWHMKASGTAPFWDNPMDLPNLIIDATDGRQLKAIFATDPDNTCERLFDDWQILTVGLAYPGDNGCADNCFHEHWWHYSGGAITGPATAEDIRHVLSDVAGIWIRAQFKGGVGTTYLDEIVLMPNAQPALQLAR